MVDFTNTYHQSKDEKKSFFLYSVHFLLQCVNEVEAFKLRIEGEQVVKYDFIHLSPTIGREDGTFGFGFFEYDADLEIIGVRKAEGGIRSASYKTCFSESKSKGCNSYRPVFWYTDSDKKAYEEFYGIQHSRCYTEYGLKRTGCVGCPYLSLIHI